MKRKSSTEGTLYQLPSGSWRAQISVDGQRHSATRRTRIEAREWLRQVKEQAGLGLNYDAAQVKLGEFLPQWLAIKAGQLRPATQRSYGLAAQLNILPILGRYKVSELNRATIQAWIGMLSEKGAGVRMIEIARMVLHNCLEHARQIGLVGYNAVDMVMVPKAPAVEMQIWTESQVSQFLVAARGNRLEALYHLALVTGMRRGELLGLKWSDIDWGGRIQVVRQAISVDGGGYTFAETKSARGRRSIEVGMNTIERLREQEKRVHELRMVFRQGWVENDLVFPTQRGGPHCGGNIVKSFRALARQAGVPVIRFHDLRHTAATIMLSHGIPPVIVAGMLGHTVTVLMTRYAHYIPTMQGEAARLMDEITSPVDMQGAFAITHELPTKGKGYRQG